MRIFSKNLDQTENLTNDSLLIEVVRSACMRLESKGWKELFRAHGLDICATNLKDQLLRPLEKINRTINGFQDFSAEGCRGIEPGCPAKSLLFHAFASPQVIHYPDGTSPLLDFPTPLEIEAVENLVYGIKPPSIQELRVRAGNAHLAIVVFASEYRPAISSVHQKHADVCFSRVGITRVGTAEYKYIPAARGYLPFVEDDPFSTRVAPCRYSAYIATQLFGDKDSFGPLQFKDENDTDKQRKFWVPIHKLFYGNECIRGFSLNVTLSAYHQNEKLKRVHQAMGSKGYDTGRYNPDILKPPFLFNEGIAEFSQKTDDGIGLLIPVVHKRLVEPAIFEGKPLSYKVPEGVKLYSSSINIEGKSNGARTAPEYVHMRHRLENDNSITDLNNEKEMSKIITKGGYNALHYIDFTGDGYIQVECPELALEVPHVLAAYSMVAPVDFFPLVKQTELLQWWQQSVPDELIENIWPSNPGPPTALCDIRYPANLSLTYKKYNIKNEPRAVFDSADDSICAIVGLMDAAKGQLTQIDNLINERVSSLPDSAAGVFAPGWDTSIDRTEEIENDDKTIKPGVFHFNNYGLGSPFPEDALLCSALSSFWPAAAPDITRTFAPIKYATATPLTDEVLGLTGELPWDGILGPTIPDPAVKEIEYRNLFYADYINTALQVKFNYEIITKTTAAEYAARTLVMARVYAALGAITREEKVKWGIFSFINALSNDPELNQAESDTDCNLNQTFTYRFKMFKHKETFEQKPATDHRNILVEFDKMITIYADPKTVIMKNDNGKWEAKRY